MKMPRPTAIILAIALIFALVQPALAKGLVRATVSGPCLSEEIELSGNGEPGGLAEQLTSNDHPVYPFTPRKGEFFLLQYEIGWPDDEGVFQVFATNTYHYFPNAIDEGGVIVWVTAYDGVETDYTGLEGIAWQAPADGEAELKDLLTEHGVDFTPYRSAPFSCQDAGDAGSGSWLASLWRWVMAWLN